MDQGTQPDQTHRDLGTMHRISRFGRRSWTRVSNFGCVPWLRYGSSNDRLASNPQCIRRQGGRYGSFALLHPSAPFHLALFLQLQFVRRPTAPLSSSGGAPNLFVSFSWRVCIRTSACAHDEGPFSEMDTSATVLEVREQLAEAGQLGEEDSPMGSGGGPATDSIGACTGTTATGTTATSGEYDNSNDDDDGSDARVDNRPSGMGVRWGSGRSYKEDETEDEKPAHRPKPLFVAPGRRSTGTAMTSTARAGFKQGHHATPRAGRTRSRNSDDDHHSHGERSRSTSHSRRRSSSGSEGGRGRGRGSRSRHGHLSASASPPLVPRHVSHASGIAKLPPDWTQEGEAYLRDIIQLAQVNSACHELAALYYANWFRVAQVVIVILTVVVGSRGLAVVISGSASAADIAIGVCEIVLGIVAGGASQLDLKTKFEVFGRRSMAYKNLANFLKLQMVTGGIRPAFKDLSRRVSDQLTMLESSAEMLPLRFRQQVIVQTQNNARSSIPLYQAGPFQRVSKRLPSSDEHREECASPTEATNGSHSPRSRHRRHPSPHSADAHTRARTDITTSTQESPSPNSTSSRTPSTAGPPVPRDTTIRTIRVGPIQHPYQHGRVGGGSGVFSGKKPPLKAAAAGSLPLQTAHAGAHASTGRNGAKAPRTGPHSPSPRYDPFMETEGNASHIRDAIAKGVETLVGNSL